MLVGALVLAVVPSALAAPVFKADPHRVSFGRQDAGSTTFKTLTITNVSSSSQEVAFTLEPSEGFALEDTGVAR
jgi:hypothetical protein